MVTGAIISTLPPVDPDLTANLPPKRLHVLTSKTGKLHLELQARGKEHVVLVQEAPDGDVTLDGHLQVHLREPESITHVRVRLKGMVRTLVQKAHASGRHPVSDEVDFFEGNLGSLHRGVGKVFGLGRHGGLGLGKQVTGLRVMRLQVTDTRAVSRPFFKSFLG